MKNLKFLIRIFVTFGSLYYILSHVRNLDIFNILSNAKIYLIALSFLFVLLSYIIQVIRWHRIESLILERTTLHNSGYLYSVSYISNTFLPMGIAGDAFRIWKLKKQSNRTVRAASLVVMERIIGLFCLLSLASCSSAAHRILDPFILIALNIFILVCILFIFFKLLDVPICLLLTVLFLSYTIQIFAILSIVFLAQAFNYVLTFGQLLVYAPVLLIAMFIPISIGGFGLRELASVEFAQYVMNSVSLSFAVSVVFGVEIMIVSLLGYLVFSHHANRKSK